MEDVCISGDKRKYGLQRYRFKFTSTPAKQAWRLVDDPDSLCAMFLKARYYPTGDLLNVESKNGSSFTWQNRYMER